ncbi:DUF488 family protein [Streptomyces sp. A3M-1-3]|uniref:DUF488 domain-containing protein n=1 Tax=Streptomyces sp. A3M-1-3 TaxID=2962044 RepID=UPI0020B7CC4D|nr:DUF488 family protein [Streptomyces sp. A3M-1-3]MCP3818052.1 DUF488 family protein [Streptomyces sp. A3M-1-3]
MSDIRVRRVYEAPADDDGTRVLADRLWPRGLSKDAARVDEWPKALTPSTELRRWYHGQSGDTYAEFRRRYEAELDAPDAAAAVDGLRELARTGRLTLLTASKDPERSHAAILADRLVTRRRRG